MCISGGTIAQAVPVAAGAEESGPLLSIPLEPVDAVTVTTLVDNVTDLLAMDAGPAPGNIVKAEPAAPCSGFRPSARYSPSPDSDRLV